MTTWEDWRDYVRDSAREIAEAVLPENLPSNMLLLAEESGVGIVPLEEMLEEDRLRTERVIVPALIIERRASHYARVAPFEVQGERQLLIILGEANHREVWQALVEDADLGPWEEIDWAAGPTFDPPQAAIQMAQRQN